MVRKNKYTGRFTAVGRPKYKNKKTDGFDSKKERDRYLELQLLEKAGEIYWLKTQVEFELIPKQDGERKVTYKADFVYYGKLASVMTVEDCKGFRTRDYIIKRKLMLWVHGIRVLET